MQKGLKLYSFYILGPILIAVLSLSACFGLKEPNLAGKSASDQMTYGQQISMKKQESAILAKSIRITDKAGTQDVPDEIIARIQIISTKETSSQALNENMLIAAAVTEALNKLQINDLRVDTAGFSVQALYEDQSKAHPAIDAYRAVTTLEARTAQIEKIDLIISIAIHSGAKEISSFSYDLTENSKKIKK